MSQDEDQPPQPSLRWHYTVAERDLLLEAMTLVRIIANDPDASDSIEAVASRLVEKYDSFNEK